MSLNDCIFLDKERWKRKQTASSARAAEIAYDTGSYALELHTGDREYYMQLVDVMNERACL